MSSKITFGVLLVMAISLTSCSHRLTGTWTIQHYESVTQGSPGFSLSNIGTLTFHNNGKGDKNINYTVFGTTTEDIEPFKWRAQNNLVTIDDNVDSAFNKTWIVIEDKRNYQKWRSTDGKSEVQTLILTK